MFKPNILRLLKTLKIYGKINRNDVLLKSVINSPYINTILKTIHYKISDFNWLTYVINDNKFKTAFQSKTIIIENIKKERYDEIKKYLFENGIIWCNYLPVGFENDNFWDYHKNVNLYIDNEGRLSYSSVDWKPTSINEYISMSLDEFYVYFETLKARIKNNISLCRNAYSDNRYLIKNVKY